MKRDSSKVHPASFLGNPTVEVENIADPGKKVEELCNYIFKYGDDRCKTRALLCGVFHNAVHDRYHRARDMFLISHIQDSVDKLDVNTQILYNRALVMLGLAAFRQGLIQKAHDCLMGVCSSRVKELLAQGQFKRQDKDPEQEKIEKRRQIPYHMHINPDLLECCHLTCAMLLELPLMARGAAATGYVISKHFRRHLQQYNRQVFTGPPENVREHVLAASRHLLAGDWSKACNLIINIDKWNLLPADGGERVKAMLLVKIKEEALRTYLLTHGMHYESVSLKHICDLFEMDEVTARRVVSRMICQKDISGAWELNPIETLILYKVEPTVVQTLSLQVAERVASLVESNERLLDPLFGADKYGYKDDWKDKAANKWAEQEGGGGTGRKQWNSSAWKGGHSKYPSRGGSGRTNDRAGNRGAGGAQSSTNRDGGKSAWAGRGGEGSGRGRGGPGRGGMGRGGQREQQGEQNYGAKRHNSGSTSGWAH